jgi:tripartite-type tricarboxylate transporter receptor subunit TctC
MWVDVASGQSQVAVGSYQAFTTVQSCGVRNIGVTGNYRSPKLPDVPTLVEQGIDKTLVDLEGGLPLMAPAGTPEAVLQLLSNVAVEWAETERAAKLRVTRQEWEAAVPVWVKLAVDLGIKLD